MGADLKEIVPGLYRYSVALLLLVGALALGVGGSLLLAAGALILAGLAFFTTRELARRLELAEKHKSLLDEQIIQSQKLASIGELSSGIAHEINNPLAIIRQEGEWMSRLLNKSGLGEREELKDVQESLKVVIQQVDRCKEITHNLLDFARKREPVFQEFNVSEVIEGMTRLVEKEAQKNNVTITREYQADLPPVFGDPPLLRQVVLNLLTNAAHAIGQDGVITITTRAAGDALEIIITDTGAGIPPENLAKVFDPFFTTKPAGRGTGLGLSICYGIIQKMGGRISVESRVGQGTAFTVSLPRKTEKLES
jgi:two-component system NtrC family sensor kinase